MAKECRMHNVSWSGQAVFRTGQGNVRVTQFKKGLWQVLERGKEPYMVRSKRKAFSEACGIERARREGRR